MSTKYNNFGVFLGFEGAQYIYDTFEEAEERACRMVNEWGVPREEPTYQEAVSAYLVWARQHPGDPNMPNAGLSEQQGDDLANVNGLLAVVDADLNVTEGGDQ